MWTGLVKPVAASVAREMGADIVIAVNISNLPANNQTKSMLDVLMQTFDIMSGSINRYELRQADVVINPVTRRSIRPIWTTSTGRYWKGRRRQLLLCRRSRH